MFHQHCTHNIFHRIFPTSMLNSYVLTCIRLDSLQYLNAIVTFSNEFDHIVHSYYHFSFTVTYFVTYGTAIACYAYFVLTRQDYLLPDVRDRQYLLNFHKRARKSEWDISKYNSLKEGICRAEVELSKLKDHTKLRFLEINRLEILTKVKNHIKIK